MQVGDVGDEIEADHLVISHNYAYEVYPHLGGDFVEGYVVVYGAHKVADFTWGDGLLRRTPRTLATCLDLHEVVVPIGRDGHNVYLVVPTAPIEFGYGVAKGVAQVFGGGFLARGTYA